SDTGMHGWFAKRFPILRRSKRWISYRQHELGRMMSEDWNTKYGTRRVRRDPPTLEEAIFAASGITEDLECQAEIAASLMGMPIEAVQAEVKKTARTAAR